MSYLAEVMSHAHQIEGVNDGRKRWANVQAKKLGDYTDPTGIRQNEDEHILGCMTERLIACEADLPYDGWRPQDFTDRPDVGPFEVRGSWIGSGRLIIHPKETVGDFGERPFVLVRWHRFPQAEVVGWCYGHEASELGELWTPYESRPLAWWIKDHGEDRLRHIWSREELIELAEAHKHLWNGSTSTHDYARQ